MRKNPLLFIHIPKTAGTSFRIGTEKFLGKKNVLNDYSVNAAETSALVNEYIYEKKDFFGFWNKITHKNALDALVGNDFVFLGGHVQVMKYVHLFGARQTISFLRDPVQRVVSQHRHFVRHKGFKGDLPSFYRAPSESNRQAKQLNGIPLESLGFIGLTERYVEGLKVFNQRYGFNVAYVAENLGRDDKNKNYDLPEEMIEEILQLNDKDVLLHQKACVLFSERMRISTMKMPYVHGAILNASNKSVSGWAWYEHNEKAVALDVLVNGQLIAHIMSHDLATGLLRINPPRQGYVGFHYSFSAPLKADSNVQIRVPETEQIIGQATV